MAKTEVLAWSYWRDKEQEVKIPRTFKEKAKKALPIAVAVIGGVTFALHGADISAWASSPDAVPAMAQMASDTAEFSQRLRQATKPIRDIIMSFGHEIYAVMMLWGGIEALIGKFQQGVARMKASTIAYILLVWVPWIVDTVSATAGR